MKRYLVHHASDLDWAKAELLSDFSFPWEEREPSPTEFRALWNETALHFRFDCVDEDLVLGDGANDSEKVMGSDRVEIFLSPAPSLRPYYGLEMDPRGAVLEYQARYHREFNWDWKCEGLTLDTSIEGNRYQVTGSIPLSTLLALGVLKSDSKEFLAGVFRAEFSHLENGKIHQGWMAWVDPETETPDFHVPTSFGLFELVD